MEDRLLLGAKGNIYAAFASRFSHKDACRFDISITNRFFVLRPITGDATSLEEESLAFWFLFGDVLRGKEVDGATQYHQGQHDTKISKAQNQLTTTCHEPLPIEPYSAYLHRWLA